jgi:hypothetical protein
MKSTTKATKSKENISVRGFFRDLGPGLITGAAADSTGRLIDQRFQGDG